MGGPERDHAGYAALAVVFRTHSDIEASIVLGLLEAHGIYAAASSDLTHSVFPLSIDGLGEVRISVPVSQAEAAVTIIREQGTSPQSAEIVQLADDTRDLSALEERLGYTFREPAVLDRALTHRSRANEDATGSTVDNESLEFLGEAVIAAVYLDGGIEEARRFVTRAFAEDLEDVRSPEFWGRDYKSALQELVQSHEVSLPEYTVASESGPDHRKMFHVEVRVRGELLGSAHGASKKAAEQEAAHKAIDKLSEG